MLKHIATWESYTKIVMTWSPLLLVMRGNLPESVCWALKSFFFLINLFGSELGLACDFCIFLFMGLPLLMLHVLTCLAVLGV